MLGLKDIKDFFTLASEIYICLLRVKSNDISTEEFTLKLLFIKTVESL